MKAFISQEVASSKPYDTFEEFYPYYLTEHRLASTRQWHYLGTMLVLIYALMNPILLLPMFAGTLSAYATMPFARCLSTGVPEVALFLSVYLATGRLLTRSFVRPLIPIFCGYGFSWIGHFGFEQNRPAAFVYPTYSLFGDFRMMYNAIREQRF
jgi:hypothetical protein